MAAGGTPRYSVRHAVSPFDPSRPEQMCAGKSVIVRTLDVGGDKFIPGLSLDVEENPFLGVRGIRLCLENRELFKAQLTAILKASSAACFENQDPMNAVRLSGAIATKAIIQEVGCRWRRRGARRRGT